MFDHRNDKIVLRIFAFYFIISLIIDFLEVFPVIKSQKNYFETVVIRIFHKIYFFISCGIVACLYKDLLKYEIKKSNKKRKITCFFVIFDILTVTIMKQLFSLSKEIRLVQKENYFFILIDMILLFFDVVFFTPFFEEIIFRRFLYQLIKKNKHLQKSIETRNYCQIYQLFCMILLNSIVFGILHYSEMFTSFFPWPFLYFTIGDMSLCLCCELTGTIISPMIVHMLYNLFIIIFNLFTSGLKITSLRMIFNTHSSFLFMDFNKFAKNDGILPEFDTKLKIM